jgi:hypothetical protein
MFPAPKAAAGEGSKARRMHITSDLKMKFGTGRVILRNKEVVCLADMGRLR